MAYLHVAGIIHGDVKAANVLVSTGGDALLCDFGLSRPSASATATLLRGAGSVRWMSPELFREGGGTKTMQSDVWAFGMFIYEVGSHIIPYDVSKRTLYKVLSGFKPFHDKRELQIYHTLVELKARPPMEPEASVSGVPYREVWSLGGACWSETPQQRPTMNAIHQQLETLKHSWKKILSSPSPVSYLLR